MGAVVARARALLRTNVRATLVLALIAGLGAGAVLAAWSAARRSASSFDRFLEAGGQPDMAVQFCAPDVTEEQLASEEGCPAYEARSEAAAIRKMPGVRAISRGSFVFGTFEVGGQSTPGFIGTLIDESDFPTYAGSPRVTAGRLADPTVAREVVVPEELADLYGLSVGDTVGFTAQPRDIEREPKAGRLELVGLVRTPADLVARLDPSAATFSNAIPLAGPAFWARYGRDAQSWGTVILAQVDSPDAERFESVLLDMFPGRDFFVSPVRDLDGEQHARDAIGYETMALSVAALVGAAAWILFVGQALARQSIEEDAEAHTLIVLGMTRRQLLGAAALRALPVAIGATVLAVVVAVLSSGTAPTRVAAAAETDPGIGFDALVVVAGIVAIASVTILGLSYAAMRRARETSRSAKAARLSRLRRALPTFVAVGIGLVTAPKRRALPLRVAVATVTVAVAVAVTGPGLVASLDDLVEHPRRYGTTWDSAITGDGDPFLGEVFEPARRAARASPDVAAAAGLNINNEGHVGGLAVPIVAFWSLDGPEQAWSVITAGRAPEARDEVALGPKTMRTLELALGDRARVRMYPDDAPTPVTVVGEALVNDGFTVDSGKVAVVDARWFGNARERAADMIVLRTSSPRATGLDDVSVVDSPPPAAVRNLVRVDSMPIAIAWFIALLALAVLGHAMIVVARNERRQLAVLRALGCTRAHLAMTLASSALTIVGLGVIIGIPLGLVAEQVLWSQLERQGGFASAPVASWRSGVIIAAAVLLAAAIGALQGWLAGRRRPAMELQVE